MSTNKQSLREIVKTWPTNKRPHGIFDDAPEPTTFYVGGPAYLVESGSYTITGRRVRVVRKTRTGVSVASETNDKYVVSVTTRSRKYKLFPIDDLVLRYEANVRNSALAGSVGAALEGCRGWSMTNGRVIPDNVADILRQLADAIRASAPADEEG